MDVKETIKQTTDAVKGFKGEIRQVSQEVSVLSDRLQEIEQKQAGGYTASNSPSFRKDSLSQAISDTDQFKSFVNGETRNCGFKLHQPLLAKNTITGDVGSPAQPGSVIVEPNRMPGIVAGAFRELRIRDLMPVLSTTSNMIEITRELAWTNNAAPQSAEGATKAESDLTFELLEIPVRTIAHFLRTSKQVLADQPALRILLDERMSHGVLLEEESQILTGDNTGANLDGLIPNATAYALSQSGDTLLDTLRRAIQQVEVADYMANGIVLHPDDWAEIELLKDNESRYLFSKPQAASPREVWGLPVVTSNSMNTGEFIVADFARAAILWDRQDVMVELSEHDSDNFTRNLVTVRAEERVALSVIRPAAIVHGTF